MGNTVPLVCKVRGREALACRRCGCCSWRLAPSSDSTKRNASCLLRPVLLSQFSPAASAVVLPTSPWCECPPGMFCPNISKGIWSSVRNLTCPSACPPTEACARERLQGKYCEPQG